MSCISNFIDDIMFLHNAANGSNSTRMFRQVRQVSPPIAGLSVRVKSGRGSVLLWRQCSSYVLPFL